MNQERELIERDGALGYICEDGITFKAMTNWAPKVIALAVNDGITEGCIVQHPPKGVTSDNERR